MKKIVKTFDVYDFNELHEDIQKKIIEKNRNIAYEDYIDFGLERDMNLEAKQLLKEYFENAKYETCLYDLSYSQGSGAMVEFTIDIKDLNDKYNIFSEEEMKLIKNEKILESISIKHNDSSSYCHQHAFLLDYDLVYIDYDEIKDKYDISEKDYDNIEYKLYSFEPFKKDIVKMNMGLTNVGYKLIEYDGVSDDFIMELCYSDKYLENGDVFYE